MSSVVTNLVTSLEFQPIRWATMLLHFGRTRNGYVDTRFILPSSTAENSATSGCVVAPERLGQSQAWAGRNVERTRKKPSFVPNSGFNRCSMQQHVNMKFPNVSMNFISCITNFFRCVFINFLLWKTSLIFCLCYYLLCRRGNNHTRVHFWRIEPVFFLSKNGKDAVHERRNGRRGSYLPPELAFSFHR